MTNQGGADKRGQSRENAFTIRPQGDGRPGNQNGHTRSAQLPVVMLSLAVVLVALGQTTGHSAEATSTPMDWVEEYRDGGELRLHTLNAVEVIDMKVSSDFGNGTMVLRGFNAAGATASLLVSPQLVAGVINHPTGAIYRFKIDENGIASTPLEAPKTDEWPIDPLQNGPISIEVDTVPMPPAFPINATDAAEEQFCDETCRALYSFDVMEELHISPMGGHSIRISRHIYDGSAAIDPVNVIFFGASLGYSLAHHTVEHGGAYKSTTCGSPKSARFLDSQVGHTGGSDEWEVQEEGTDRHYEAVIFGEECTQRQRGHIRFYESDSGDTHDPGFGDYVLAPTHTEDSGHEPETVDPQRGQDLLFAILGDNPHVAKIHTYPTQTGSCASCERWTGVIDLYEIVQATANLAGLVEVRGTPATCGLAGSVNAVLTGGSTIQFDCVTPIPSDI